MIVGIIVGITWVVSLIIAFMIGYGLADMKHKPLDEEQEQ